jgi:hypothetical protein
MLCIWAFLIRDEKTVYNRLLTLYSDCHHQYQHQAPHKLDLDEKSVVISFEEPEYTEHVTTPNSVVGTEHVDKTVNEGVLRFYFSVLSITPSLRLNMLMIFINLELPIVALPVEAEALVSGHTNILSPCTSLKRKNRSTEKSSRKRRRNTKTDSRSTEAPSRNSPTRTTPVSECGPYQSHSQSQYLPIIDTGSPFCIDFGFDLSSESVDPIVHDQNATSDTPTTMEEEPRSLNDPSCEITIRLIPPSTPSSPYDELAYEEPEIIFYPESELVDWEST